MAPLTRQERLQSQLAYLSSDSNVWEDDSSPQFLALTWLANNDTVDERDIPRVEARYALATLYFATNGDEWKDNLQFLSPNVHECHWNSRSQGVVSCNADWEITGLVFGMYLCAFCLDAC
jgi:hypothetical protein